MSSLTSPESQQYQQQVLAGLYQINQRQISLDETQVATQADVSTLKSNVEQLQADLNALKTNAEKIDYKLDVSQKSSKQLLSLASNIVVAVTLVFLLYPLVQAITPTLADFVTQLITQLSDKISGVDVPVS